MAEDFRFTISPLEKALISKHPFVYWHVNAVGPVQIGQAITANSSIEIDVSFDDRAETHPDKRVFVGHPLTIYTFKHLPLPNNVPFADAIQALKNSSTIIVFDCKDERAISVIKNAIRELGVSRVIVHAFIKEWGFPYPDGTIPEPHWDTEDVRLAAIKELHEATGVNIIGAIRGFSVDRLEKNPLVANAIAQAGNTFRSISIYLPGTPIPPTRFLQLIADAGYLPWLNIDNVTDENRLPNDLRVYVAMTDDLAKATKVEELAQS